MKINSIWLKACSPMLLLVLLVFLIPSVSSGGIGQSADGVGFFSEASWMAVRCNDNVSGPAVCACEGASRSEIRCRLEKGLQVPHGMHPCVTIQPLKMSSLIIDCGIFGNCATVHLGQLVYRSSLLRLEVSQCQIDEADDADPPGRTNFALISDRDMGISGSAGFLSSVSNQSAGEVARHGCSLLRLRIIGAEMKFPTSLVQKCPSLYSINISNSRLQDLTDLDVLAMSTTKDVIILTGNELFYFGDGLLKRALDGMNHEPLRLECIKKKCSNFTTGAKAVIELLIETNGAVADSRKLYYRMENKNIHFRLMLGQTEGVLHVPSPLSKLDLSNNRLSIIPTCLSMMGNLSLLNLSRNRIEDLYHESGCWGGPPSGIPLSPEQKTKRQCYWFWASRKTLKNLDLSHNLITFLGQVEPWYQVELSHLNLSHNRISVLGSDTFTGNLAFNLRFLFVDNNLLETVQLNGLKQIDTFSANNNQIACIKRDTLPNSKNMTNINLANNEISSIAPYVFKHYTLLQKVDLSNNSLEKMAFYSFETSPRQAPSDRVELSIIDQKTMPVCDCKHFYSYAMREVESDDNVFTMPGLSINDVQTMECRLIPATHYGPNQTAYLAALHPDSFGCQFHDYSKLELPVSVCQQKGARKCIGRCNPGCYCCTNGISTIMNCSIDGIHLSGKNIPMPVTVLDFSLVKTLFIEALRNSTLTWQFKEDRHSLREFYAHRSDLVSIDDYAFNMTPGVTKISISYNRLKKLTKRTFAGLENTLNHLELGHNNFTTISVEKVFQPLGALANVTLFGNPFECSCSTTHLNYLKEMAEYNNSKSVIRDYSRLTCTLVGEFVKDFKNYNLSSVYTNFTLSSFPMDSVSLLNRICEEMDELKSQLKMKILKTSLITLGVAVGLIALVLLVHRRHFVQSMIMFTIMAHLMKPRRIHRDKSYHVFFYFDIESDGKIVADIFNHLTNPSLGFPISTEVKVCHSGEFSVSNNIESPQQVLEIESIEKGVDESVKVLVLLSTGLLQKKAKEIMIINNRLGNRRMAQDLILITLDRKYEIEVQLTQIQETYRSSQEREGMKMWMRLAACRQMIRYGSRDWHYNLFNCILANLPHVSTGGKRRGSVYGTNGITIAPDSVSERELLLSSNSTTDELQMTETPHIMITTIT